MHTLICILCINRIIISIFLASFQLILFLCHTAYVSLSDHAAPWYFAIHCSAWAASSPGWFHFNSRWEAPRLLLHSLCHRGFAGHCSSLLLAHFEILRCVGLCSTLFSIGNPAKIQQYHPNTQNRPSFLLAWISSVSLFWFACLWKVCAFCRQHGGGGRGWQGRWRTRWYTEHIEQCIIYWVM